MVAHRTTIAAIATPNGYGGVGIVRLSGPAVLTIAQQLFAQPLRPRYAHYSSFLDKDHNIIDTGIVLYFPGPHSFTGEDVLELQGHGGVVVLNLLLNRVVELGAQLAKPGEFSERAFLNNKIDLLQAEAIADLISASSTQAAQAAQRSLQGEFSKKITDLNEKIIFLRMYVEAAIDFPEEEIDFLNDGNIKTQLDIILTTCNELIKKAQQGVLLQQGICVVLAGEPNAGKSSLLNLLAQKEVAIVTEIPGTTRDVLHAQINIAGIPLHITDTAGLRESTDIIEQEGIKRAQAEIKKADIILWVVDSHKQHPHIGHKEAEEFLDKTIVVYNKIDLSHVNPKDDPNAVYLSAKTGEGFGQLEQKILTKIGATQTSSDQVSARVRHLNILKRTQVLLQQGSRVLEEINAGELLAEHLRQAHNLLGEVTGRFTADDLLGEIFSSFCIGK
jgi:tRNA modification GTPase